MPVRSVAAVRVALAGRGSEEHQRPKAEAVPLVRLGATWLDAVSLLHAAHVQREPTEDCKYLADVFLNYQCSLHAGIEIIYAKKCSCVFLILVNSLSVRMAARLFLRVLCFVCCLRV